MPLHTTHSSTSIRQLAALLLLPLCPTISHSQTVVTAGSVNGVLNPTQFAGSDIGAQINTAWKSGATVRVPAGSYTFSTTIVHPGAGYKLECDTGATLTYTGSSDAITLANGNLGNNQDAGIDGDGGCVLRGTSSAQSGIHIFPSNHTFIRNIRITGFTNTNYGYGIYDTGANSVEINNVSIFGDRTGVYLTGNASGNASNAVHIADSDISNNSGLGVDSEPNGTCCTENLGLSITNNVFEGNQGGGDIRINNDQGASVTGNYFESNGVGVNIGPTTNEWGITVEHNYFSQGNPESIELGYGTDFNIVHNTLYHSANTTSGCFINVTTGGSGGTGRIRGVGTNASGGASVGEFCNYGTATTTPPGPASTGFSLAYQ